MNTPLTIWCNADFPETAMAELRRGIGAHRLLMPPVRNASNLAPAATDPQLAEADIAFGQPDPRQVIESSRLRWVHLTTAGYTRYDTAPVTAALRSRGAFLTNSSSVYDEPCAEHVLSMMLAIARQLPQCWAEQATSRGWNSPSHRVRSHLLRGQTAVILGFGAIARRLVELLAPFGMNLIAIRRTITGTEPIRTEPQSELKRLLPHADHVINILPASASTEQFFNADLIGAMKRTALFYNIGRGNTVDALALRTALETGRIAGAYLDVTEPEPLPPESPLWRLHNCWITPHTAGGHADEFERIVRHFLENLKHFEAHTTMLDRIV